MKLAFYDLEIVALNAVKEIRRVGVDSFIEHGVNIKMIRNYEDAVEVLNAFRLALEKEEHFEECIYLRDVIKEYSKRPPFNIDPRFRYY